MIHTASISGIGQALTPVVHNEVMYLGYNPKEGEAKKQRTMPVLIEKDGQVTRHSVPIISGNAFRGIERRLLVDHSLDILDVNMEEIIQSKEEARRVLYFLRNGGLTPKDIKTKRLAVGTYNDIQRELPFLVALGGVYQGYHFEGHCKYGFMIPMAKETYPMYKNIMADDHRKQLEEKTLPSLKDITPIEIRYTRRSSAEKSAEEKESMIYGTEAIPAGTTFFSLSTVVSPYEHAVLAFKAMAFLMEQYGYVGGMTGRGHGKIMFDFIYTDSNGSQKLSEKDYEAYVSYLKDNKENIIQTLKDIPALLKWESK